MIVPKNQDVSRHQRYSTLRHPQYTHAPARTHTHTHIHTRARARIHARAYTHTHTHTHTTVAIICYWRVDRSRTWNRRVLFLFSPPPPHTHTTLVSQDPNVYCRFYGLICSDEMALCTNKIAIIFRIKINE